MDKSVIKPLYDQSLAGKYLQNIIGEPTCSEEGRCPLAVQETNRGSEATNCAQRGFGPHTKNAVFRAAAVPCSVNTGRSLSCSTRFYIRIMRKMVALDEIRAVILLPSRAIVWVQNWFRRSPFLKRRLCKIGDLLVLNTYNTGRWPPNTAVFNFSFDYILLYFALLITDEYK